MDTYLINEIRQISSSMFKKNYFGVFHGSISARSSVNSFIINKKETILDEMAEEDFIELDYIHAKDYRWNEASVDVDIHEKNIQNSPKCKIYCLYYASIRYSLLFEAQYCDS